MDDHTLLSIIIPAILTFAVAVVGAFTARNAGQLKAMQETIVVLQSENKRLRERVDELERENSDLRLRLADTLPLRKRKEDGW